MAAVDHSPNHTRCSTWGTLAAVGVREQYLPASTARESASREESTLRAMEGGREQYRE